MPSISLVLKGKCSGPSACSNATTTVIVCSLFFCAGNIGKADPQYSGGTRQMLFDLVQVRAFVRGNYLDMTRTFHFSPFAPPSLL